MSPIFCLFGIDVCQNATNLENEIFLRFDRSAHIKIDFIFWMENVFCTCASDITKVNSHKVHMRPLPFSCAKNW